MPRRLTLDAYRHLTLEVLVASLEELRTYLQRLPEFPYAEVWLDLESPNALAMLVNRTHNRACLFDMGNDLRSIATDYADDAPWVQAIFVEDVKQSDKRAFLPFRLGNGQVDNICAECTVPLADALRTFEYFFEHGERAPFVTWDNRDCS